MYVKWGAIASLHMATSPIHQTIISVVWVSTNADDLALSASWLLMATQALKAPQCVRMDIQPSRCHSASCQTFFDLVFNSSCHRAIEREKDRKSIRHCIDVLAQ